MMKCRTSLVHAVLGGFLFAILAVLGGSAEEKGGPKATSECEIQKDDWLPIGQSTQGYSIEYQSGKGENCRVYRVRNTPGGIMTPVGWKYKEEVFLRTKLPKCPRGGESDWVRAIKIWGKTEKGKTYLGYGLNYDERTEEPEAYRKEARKDEEEESGADDRKEEELPPLTTVLRGRVAYGKEDNTVSIDITVSSTVGKPVNKSHIFDYMIRVGKNQTEWIRMAAKPDKTEPGLTLAWESPYSSKKFEEEVNDHRIKEPFLKPEKETSLHLYGKEAKLIEKRLVIYRGEESLAETTAPAYIPTEEQPK